MADVQHGSTATTVRDPRTGRIVTIHGVGALKGRLKLKKGVDLTKPIASQAVKGSKSAKPVVTKKH